MIGVLVLVGAVALVAVVAVVRNAVDGTFRPGRTVYASPVLPDDAPEESPQGAQAPAPAPERVTADDVGAELGQRITFVQFSSAFCSPCRATRALLTDVVADRADVAHVEVDAESHLPLVRRLGILRTPTVLVVDADGVVLSRASGVPRREQVLAVLDAAR